MVDFGSLQKDMPEICEKYIQKFCLMSGLKGFQHVIRNVRHLDACFRCKHVLLFTSSWADGAILL